MPGPRGDTTTTRSGASLSLAAARWHRVAAVRVRPTNLIALLAMPAFAAAVAPFVAAWHWSLDLLACFPVQAMGALWLAAACLAAAKRFRFAIAYTIGGAIAAAAVVPGWCATDPAVTGTATPGVRVATINLLRGNEASLDQALARIREQDPDVVFCSEVTPRWFDGLAAGLPHLAHRLARSDPGYYGVALFSRWPLRSPEVLPLGVEWTPAIRVTVDAPGGPLGVLGVHTPRPGNGARALDLAKALTALPNAIAPLPAARIVLGDFNATPWNHGFVTMLSAAGLTDGSARDHHPTWPSHVPWPLRVPIDHVLGSSSVAITDVLVGGSFASDHLPLFATVHHAATASTVR